jgi:hypothetical protein
MTGLLLAHSILVESAFASRPNASFRTVYNHSRSTARTGQPRTGPGRTSLPAPVIPGQGCRGRNQLLWSRFSGLGLQPLCRSVYTYDRDAAGGRLSGGVRLLPGPCPVPAAPLRLDRLLGRLGLEGDSGWGAERPQEVAYGKDEGWLCKACRRPDSS